MHLGLERTHELGLATTQKLRGIIDINGVIVFADQVDAWPAAAIDLMQQTGPGAVGKNRVLASTQQEDFLQNLHGLFDCPRTWERTKVLIFFINCAAIVGHARKITTRQFQVGIRFIVTKKNIKSRLLSLDEIVFQQECFGLAASDGGLQTHDTFDHHRSAWTGQRFLKITRNAFFQITRFADIQQFVLPIEITIHTRQMRQRRYFLEQRDARIRVLGRVCLRHGVASELMRFGQNLPAAV